MGGLLAADTLREFVNARTDKDCPLWPRVIACIAYDTPVRISSHIFEVATLTVVSPVLWYPSFRGQAQCHQGC